MTFLRNIWQQCLMWPRLPFAISRPEAITSVRRFDLKTQTFQEIEYHGYKANRTEMPGDLAQQLPYIRRALEAYRIPILELGRL